MNLFGCKFCDPETGTCERKNFDSLLWATVTVFQVQSSVFVDEIRKEIAEELNINVIRF